MNEELKHVKEGSNVEFITMSVATDSFGNTIHATEGFDTGRVYYPFVVCGKYKEYSLQHLPTGMKMGGFTYSKLSDVIPIIEELRGVYKACDEDIVGDKDNTVSKFLQILKRSKIDGV